MYKSGFARTHVPMKCDDHLIADSVPTFSGGVLYVTQFIYDIHRAKIFGDLQQGVEDYQLVSRLGGYLPVFLQQNLQQLHPISSLACRRGVRDEVKGKELLWKMYNGK